MSDHAELIARLEAAEVGSRELDSDVFGALGFRERKFPMDSCPYWVSSTEPDRIFPTDKERLTTSLDAALALADRVLPGYGFFLRKDKDGCNCGLVYPDAYFVTPGCGQSSTPAIALCIAILKATGAVNPQHLRYEAEGEVNNTLSNHSKQ